MGWVPNQMGRAGQLSWTILLGCALALNIVASRQGGWTWTTDAGLLCVAIGLVVSLFRHNRGLLTRPHLYVILACALCGLLIGILPAFFGQ
jgi:hypothetical protein